MLTTTHFMVAVLIGMLLELDRNEWFIAMTFGVLVDLDHLFAVPRYVDANGWDALLRPTWDDESGLPWKSVMHRPMGAAIVGPLAVGWRVMLPLSFWAAHVALDSLQSELLQYSGSIETALFAAVTVGVLYVGYSRWAPLNAGGFVAYLKHLLGLARAALRIGA